MPTAVVVPGDGAFYGWIMVARLILLLLLAVAAVPGLAMGPVCHQRVPGATRSAAMPSMPANRDHMPAAEHRCIGCMPLPRTVTAPIVPPAPRVRLPRPMPARLDLRAVVPPALPPPRIG